MVMPGYKDGDSLLPLQETYIPSGIKFSRERGKCIIQRCWWNREILHIPGNPQGEPLAVSLYVFIQIKDIATPFKNKMGYS
jgi:hypothetical protein